jgi:hypothetical protein
VVLVVAGDEVDADVSGGTERRGQADWRLDSERVERFVDISALFAAKCPQ